MDIECGSLFISWSDFNFHIKFTHPTDIPEQFCFQLDLCLFLASSLSHSLSSSLFLTKSLQFGKSRHSKIQKCMHSKSGILKLIQYFLYLFRRSNQTPLRSRVRTAFILTDNEFVSGRNWMSHCNHTATFNWRKMKSISESNTIRLSPKRGIRSALERLEPKASWLYTAIMNRRNLSTEKYGFNKFRKFLCECDIRNRLFQMHTHHWHLHELVGSAVKASAI